MSFFVAGSIFVATTALQASVARNAKKNAQKDAKIDSAEANKQARKAEVFAETEGDGIGQMGQISLEVDQDLEEEEISSGNIRI